jgi:hypothetical protein
MNKALIQRLTELAAQPTPNGVQNFRQLKTATIRKFRIVQTKGSRQLTRKVDADALCQKSSTVRY